MPALPMSYQRLQSAKATIMFSPPNQRKIWRLNTSRVKAPCSDHLLNEFATPLDIRSSGFLGKRSRHRKDSDYNLSSNGIIEDDLDEMVRDFIENGIPEHDLDRCQHSEEHVSGEYQLKAVLSMGSEERDVYQAIESIISSLNINDIYLWGHGSACNGNCIRRLLVRHLRMAGYNAGLCKVNWESTRRRLGGTHEFIDVLLSNDRQQQRLIIDMDFKSQFQIARPMDEYKEILSLIPFIFVTKPRKLEEVLEIMAAAGISSFRESSFHIPPWRTLEYIRAKWFSEYQRLECFGVLSAQDASQNCGRDEYCRQHLQQLKSLFKP